MKFQKFTTIIIIIMLIINTACNVYMANKIRNIDKGVSYIMKDTLWIRNEVVPYSQGEP